MTVTWEGEPGEAGSESGRSLGGCADDRDSGRCRTADSCTGHVLEHTPRGAISHLDSTANPLGQPHASLDVACDRIMQGCRSISEKSARTSPLPPLRLLARCRLRRERRNARPPSAQPVVRLHAPPRRRDRSVRERSGSGLRPNTRSIAIRLKVERASARHSRRPAPDRVPARAKETAIPREECVDESDLVVHDSSVERLPRSRPRPLCVMTTLL